MRWFEAVALTFVASCGGARIVDGDDSTGPASQDNAGVVSSADSGTTLGGDVDPEAGTSVDQNTGGSTSVGTGSETSGEPSATETGSQSDCTLLATASIDHVAFSGRGCYRAANENTVLTTQDEVDAHAQIYCEGCVGPDVCAPPPELEPGTIILYAHATTPHGPADVQILSVEACAEAIVVHVFVTIGPQTAFDYGWDSVAVAASDNPVVFEVETSWDF